MAMETGPGLSHRMQDSSYDAAGFALPNQDMAQPYVKLEMPKSVCVSAFMRLPELHNQQHGAPRC